MYKPFSPRRRTSHLYKRGAYAPLFDRGPIQLLDACDMSTMWQDSAQTRPVTRAGDMVGYWADKSDYNNYAIKGGGGNRPVYRTDGGSDGNCSALHFDFANMDIPNLSWPASSFTFYYVFHTTYPLVQGALYEINAGPTAGADTLAFSVRLGTDTTKSGLGFNEETNDVLATDVDIDIPAVYCFNLSNIDGTVIARNGVQIATGGYQPEPLSSSAPNSSFIGSETSASRSVNGLWLYELQVWPWSHDQYQQASIEASLMNKWGIT